MYRANGRSADSLFEWIEEQTRAKRGIYGKRLDPDSTTCRIDVMELAHLLT